MSRQMRTNDLGMTIMTVAFRYTFIPRSHSKQRSSFYSGVEKSITVYVTLNGNKAIHGRQHTDSKLLRSYDIDRCLHSNRRCYISRVLGVGVW